MKDKNEYRLYFRRVPTYEDFQNNLDKYLKIGDDVYLDNACFLCQQSLEFLLKGILQYFDVNFPTNGKEGRDIKLLCNLIVNNTPIQFESKDRLEKISNIITQWETQGRYGDGVKVKIDTLKNVKNIYNEIDNSFIEFRKYEL